ncbi:hypothetical protein XNC1_0847 [Xenorhabdus nematophila ATCC 19061]|uniref:Uncharacterized protein n=1 Tax=Xenorhabdus nematophila (strain ATCC 19061 / DSM 3370 / CCUG 14189 / LMG 1036 / NCIMB 9965 / AN6) TaxID=406817 RepID=D3VKG6_XENNA|nr:hypothetical protein XNC1_0847 [Xenorhabdus nematophila ATCC 19061]CEK21828.1 hypothetical protein XNC2_0832 [Xenorhabdus nematophila AN6/1]
MSDYIDSAIYININHKTQHYSHYSFNRYLIFLQNIKLIAYY